MNIKIHDFTWEIVFVDKVEDQSDDSEITCGKTYKTKLRIDISTQQKDSLVRHSIIHELVHAYIWSWGLENSTPFNEEQIANFIETHGPDILTQADKIYNYYLNKVATK